MSAPEHTIPALRSHLSGTFGPHVVAGPSLAECPGDRPLYVGRHRGVFGVFAHWVDELLAVVECDAGGAHVEPFVDEPVLYTAAGAVAARAHLPFGTQAWFTTGETLTIRSLSPRAGRFALRDRHTAWTLTPIVDDEGHEGVLRVDNRGVVLGRSPHVFAWAGESVALSAPTPDIARARFSRRHAALWVDGGFLFVCDLGSVNGTRLGPMKLPPHTPALVRAGDVVCVGKRLAMRAEPSA